MHHVASPSPPTPMAIWLLIRWFPAPRTSCPAGFQGKPSRHRRLWQRGLEYRRYPGWNPDVGRCLPGRLLGRRRETWWRRATACCSLPTMALTPISGRATGRGGERAWCGISFPAVLRVQVRRTQSPARSCSLPTVPRAHPAPALANERYEPRDDSSHQLPRGRYPRRVHLGASRGAAVPRQERHRSRRALASDGTRPGTRLLKTIRAGE